MSGHSQFRDPLARVRGLGSAKSGVNHWRWQRLTAIALIPLTVWFLIVAIRLFQNSMTGAISTIAYLPNTVLLLAYTIALFWHTQLGLQVVIEDYVHTRWLETALQITVKFLCMFGALASILAIIWIFLIEFK